MLSDSKYLISSMENQFMLSEWPGKFVQIEPLLKNSHKNRTSQVNTVELGCFNPVTGMTRVTHLSLFICNIRPLENYGPTLSVLFLGN